MKWIKCQNSLPPEGKIVKIKSGTLWIGKGKIVNGNWEFLWVKGACSGKISHWKFHPVIITYING